MKSPFISIRALVGGAILFAVIIAAALLASKQGPVATTASAPVTTTTTSHTRTATTSPTIAVPAATSTVTATLTISPSQIIQGDPVMVTLNGTTITDIKSATLTASGPNMPGRSATTALHFIEYRGKPIAFYGTGINQTIGKAAVTVTMKDGSKLTANFTIGNRVQPTESLPVPEQLGGNSTSSQENLVTNLDAENAELADVYSNPATSFWTAPFTWPIHASDVSGGIIVTDPFGYNRDSGAETITHKGTDFKAPPGTPVYAINAGYVRITQLFSVYGNTVVVDHGMGIQSFYMHMSKMVVTPGEAVKQGDLLGYSGETGYSEGPHLHLTIRIDGISIDPIKFYALFGLSP